MEELVGERSVSRWRGWLSTADGRASRGRLIGAIAVIAVIGGALLALLTPVGGIAVLTAGVGALLMLRDLKWGLCALLGVICLLPFGSLPFKVGFTPTFLDLVFGALYVVWGMRLITRRQADLVLTPLGLVMLIFVAMAVFSFVLGLSHSRPTANDLRTFAEVVMGFGMFFLVVNTIRERSLLRQLTAAAIVGGATQAALGVLLYVLPSAWAVRLLNPLGRLGYPVGFGALRFINDDPNRPMRAIGTSVDPNILGALLVVVLALAATQLFSKRPVLPRPWVSLSVGLMGLCLFLTYSRASMMGAVAALMMVAVLRYRRLLVVLLVAGLLLLLLPQTQAYIAHFVQGIRIEDRSTQMRMGEYEDTFRLIRRYPWVGVGFVGTPDIDLYVAVASLYLAFAAQMGLLGLLAFLVVMGVFAAHWFRAWGALPRGDDLEPLLLGYGAAVFGSLASGALDHTLLTYPHAVALLWLVVGLGTVAIEFARHADTDTAH
ncbi:MAG TPA: O-antigen ligase family protein [Anaerolineae bacterium]|nr:O-antigen ligase family protein [Anaerolineae bacterium]